jgi:glucose/arabinose dehydrogenase
MRQKFSAFLKSWPLLALFAGAAAAQTIPKVELHPLFPAYSPRLPVWMSEAPDGSGRLFIVEQEGKILIIQKGSDGGQKQEFLNIVARGPHVDPMGQNLEEGLLSIAFHPGFKTNGLFYVDYTQQNPNQEIKRRSVISEFKVSADDPNRADLASERVLLEVPQPYQNHKGGELAFGPDGFLYIALGDGGLGSDPHSNGQNTSVLLAKILRIDVNSRGFSGAGRNKKALQYGVPSDNPFVAEPDKGEASVRHEIWAYGLRNAWRYSFDRQTGDLWAGDVGQELWEEVDLVVKGGNYGWSVREGAHHFKPGPEGARYNEPVMEYTHRKELVAQGMFPEHSVGSCIVGGYVYRGKQYPALQGIYIYGDYVNGSIWGLRYGNGKVTESATMLEQPKNISSFAEDADGELYVLTLHAETPDGTGGDGAIFSLAAAK